MTPKRVFSFDEETEAREVVEKGFPGGNIDYRKMYLVAKYMRFSMGYGEIRLERELISFCKNQNPLFNPVKEANSIQDWIKIAMKYSLRKVPLVYVTSQEISTLRRAESHKERKILFATLVFAKALKSNVLSDGESSDKYYVKYDNFLDISRMAGIKDIHEKEIAAIFHKYRELFLFYDATKELIRLEYVDTQKSGDDYEIRDFKNLKPYYDELFIPKKEEHKRTKTCPRCGGEFEPKSSSHTYCQTCAKFLRDEGAKLRMRRLRSNRKEEQNHMRILE